MVKQLSSKRADAIIEKIYYQYCTGMRISVLRMTELFNMARKMLANGDDHAVIGAAMITFIRIHEPPS